jgi:plasmid stabilization system protein ParE
LARLIWTSRALRDIARLHRFLAPKDPNAARRAIRAIRQGVSYIVLYRRDGEAVVLLAIRHSKEAGYS